jgi:ketosteroid isomerase-like protein
VPKFGRLGRGEPRCAILRAVSEENIALVREGYAAFAREEPAVLLQLLDPEIVWRSIEDAETRHGVEGVIESLSGWLEVWEEFDIEPEEFVDAGRHVLVAVRERGRIKGSEREVSERFFQVWTIDAGKVTAFRE